MGALAIATGYLLGAIPFGYLLVKRRLGQDVRGASSGSNGATKVAPTPRPGAGGRTAGRGRRVSVLHAAGGGGGAGRVGAGAASLAPRFAGFDSRRSGVSAAGLHAGAA